MNLIQQFWNLKALQQCSSPGEPVIIYLDTFKLFCIVFFIFPTLVFLSNDQRQVFCRTHGSSVNNKKKYIFSIIFISNRASTYHLLYNAMIFRFFLGLIYCTVHLYQENMCMSGSKP